MNPMICESRARSIRKQVAEWLRDFRQEVYGEDGAGRLAARLEVPTRTLLNYEMGCTMPAEILVMLLEISDTHPHWLATGQKPKAHPSNLHRKG